MPISSKAPRCLLGADFTYETLVLTRLTSVGSIPKNKKRPKHIQRVFWTSVSKIMISAPGRCRHVRRDSAPVLLRRAHYPITLKPCQHLSLRGALTYLRNHSLQNVSCPLACCAMSNEPDATTNCSDCP